MKNYSKIIIAILSLVLLTVCMFGITVSADEAEGEKKLTVISQNVAYAEKMYLYYAVYPENVDVKDMVLNVYTENPDVNSSAPITATVKNATDVTISENGTDYNCRAFCTPGVALKDLSKVFYVQAVAVDGTKSAVKRYSVVEYLNEMIYTVTDSAKKAAYGDILAAGDAAQLLLDHYPNGNNDKATNYNYVKVVDGKISDGFKKGVYLTDSSIKITYTGSDSSLNGWKITSLESGTSETVAFADDVTIKESVIIEPTKLSYQPGNGRYYSSLSGSYLCYNFNGNDGQALNGASNYGTATLETRGGVAVLERTKEEWKTEHFYYSRTTNEFPGDSSNATCKVFEFDWKIGGFDLGSNNERQMFRLDGNDYIKLYKNSDGVTYSLGKADTAAIAKDEWCNVRLEFYNVSGTKYVQIYVNDDYACTQTVNDKTNTFNNRLYFYLEAAFKQVGSYVNVDNFVMMFLEKDYVAK